MKIKTPPQTDTFGAILRKLRMDRRMSLRDVEKATGISNAYLSQIEKGKRGVPTVALLFRLAKAYGLSPETMLGFIVPPEPMILNPLGKKQMSSIASEALMNLQGFTPDASFIIEKYEALSSEKKTQLKNFLLFLTEKKSK